MSLLANDLCSLVPEWDIDWSDGSGACRYGDFVVVFDSGSNVIAYHVPDRADDAVIRPDLEDAEAWNWVLYNSERWVQVLSEPDFVDPGDEAWFRSELGLGV